jgi:hypothetical protein
MAELQCLLEIDEQLPNPETVSKNSQYDYVSQIINL